MILLETFVLIGDNFFGLFLFWTICRTKYLIVCLQNFKTLTTLGQSDFSCSMFLSLGCCHLNLNGMARNLRKLIKLLSRIQNFYKLLLCNCDLIFFSTVSILIFEFEGFEYGFQAYFQNAPFGNFHTYKVIKPSYFYQ